LLPNRFQFVTHQPLHHLSPYSVTNENVVESSSIQKGKVLFKLTVRADEGQQEITAPLKPQKDQPLDSSKRPHFGTRKYSGKKKNAVVEPEIKMTAGEGQQQITALLIEKRGVDTK
jgi:hypothetical protein